MKKLTLVGIVLAGIVGLLSIQKDTFSYGYDARPTRQEMRSDVYPTISRDGGRVAFIGIKDGNQEVYVANLEEESIDNIPNTDIKQLLYSTQPSPISISNDGRKVVFVSNRNGNFEIYLANLETKILENISNSEAYDSEPSISGNGKKVAFVSDRDGNNEIYVTDLEKGTLENISNHPASESEPSISDDGRKIAFISDRDKNWEIYVANLETKTIEKISNNPAETYKIKTLDGKELVRYEDKGHDVRPRISSNGKKVVFMSYRDKNWEIYVANLEKGTLENVSNSKAYDSEPSISSNGKKIAFKSDRSKKGNWNIYITDLEKRILENISNSEAYDSEPSISGDGKKIAFTRKSNDGTFQINAEIYVADLEKGTLENISLYEEQRSLKDETKE